MRNRWLRGVSVAMILLMLPCAALAGGSGSADLYAKYQEKLDAFLQDPIWRDSEFWGGEPADIFRKQSAEVYGLSTEGGTIDKYTDARGRTLRYSVRLGGESGHWRTEYYLLNGVLCVCQLDFWYTDHAYAPSSDELYFEYAKYIQDGKSWYRLDDAGKLAYPISPPKVYTFAELDRFLAEGAPIDNANAGNGYESGQFPPFPYSRMRAALNQDMATRTGPNTKYTEPGTFPKSTDIGVFYQTGGNGVMWGMVEFEYKGERYRLYTGMKRIDAGNVPADAEDYQIAYLNRDVTPRYGPGDRYAIQPDALPANGQVKVFFAEGDYAMVDYEGFKQVVRGWVPLTAID